MWFYQKDNISTKDPGKTSFPYLFFGKLTLLSISGLNLRNNSNSVKSLTFKTQQCSTFHGHQFQSNNIINSFCFPFKLICIIHFWLDPSNSRQNVQLFFWGIYQLSRTWYRIINKARLFVWNRSRQECEHFMRCERELDGARILVHLTWFDGLWLLWSGLTARNSRSGPDFWPGSRQDIISRSELIVCRVFTVGIVITSYLS